MILSQAIIFVLGWPLEWTEIIIIFVPIFLPMLKHFNIDPILWGTLVFVNLQAAFLSPPVAMSAFYLKGVAPKHVTLNQIFAGMMPYMLHRDRLHGHHVYLARHDAVAAELSLRQRLTRIVDAPDVIDAPSWEPTCPIRPDRLTRRSRRRDRARRDLGRGTTRACLERIAARRARRSRPSRISIRSMR